MAQWDKDSVLSLKWLGSLWWHGFDPGLETSTCHGHGQPTPILTHTGTIKEKNTPKLIDAKK